MKRFAESSQEAGEVGKVRWKDMRSKLLFIWMKMNTKILGVFNLKVLWGAKPLQFEHTFLTGNDESLAIRTLCKKAAFWLHASKSKIRIETVSNNIIEALDVGPKTAISDYLEVRETLRLAKLISAYKPLHQLCHKHQTHIHNTTKHLCLPFHPHTPSFWDIHDELFNKISQ